MSKHILIVEDSRMQGMALKTFLESHGFKVYHSLSGEDALIHLKSNIPDLIISDLVLEKMHAIEFIEEVRPKMPTLKIIVLSGKIKAHEEKRLKELKVLKVLWKPVALESLLEEINEVLGL